MSKDTPSNVAASVKQKLLNIARERGVEFNLMLVHYGIERLLYRVSKSQHADTFTLKGAMLFHYWSTVPHRTTRDVDLLGSGSSDMEQMKEVFQQVCAIDVDDDGLNFDPKSVQAERIKEEDEYEGIRVKLNGHLGNARIPLQVDIGFGDAVTPKPKQREVPGLLDFAKPRMRVYPWETVVAEKYQALVELGMTNSRVKDFFDLWHMAQTLEFDGEVLTKAIKATFKRRDTELPKDTPVALTPKFTQDATTLSRWKAFTERSDMEAGTPSFPDLAGIIWSFLQPVTESLLSGKPFKKEWQPQGPW